MQLGDRGWRVRVLQSRLHQLDLHSEVVTNRFDRETRDGVATVQRRRGWTADGVVDERTWLKIVSLTTEPTTEALHNVYTPGKPLLQRGDTGMWVRQVQARLKQVRWYDARVTGRYTQATVKAVEGFQAKRRIPVTGAVDRRTLTRLKEMTREPTKAELFNIVPSGPALDPRCLTGRAMCVDKTSRSLRWVVDGVVLETVEVRFGSDELPTREGAFTVFRKSRDHVSSLYDTPMPFAMFFSGGPGRALLPRLRGQRLRRGVPRLRQRARPRGRGLAVRPGQARRQGDRLPLLTRSGAALRSRSAWRARPACGAPSRGWRGSCRAPGR